MRKITEEMYATIPAMVDAGMNSGEIAERFGCKATSLIVLCCRRGISLRRGGPRQPRASLSLEDAPLLLNEVTMVGLRRAARCRGVDAAQLASHLLKIIVADDLYNAVLDDGA